MFSTLTGALGVIFSLVGCVVAMKQYYKVNYPSKRLELFYRWGMRAGMAVAAACLVFLFAA